MDSEPKDFSNPFLKENIIETVIEKSPSGEYTKTLRQYVLRPDWPDYQEEIFRGATVDKRVLSLRQGSIEDVELKRVRNNTEITLNQGEGMGLNFGIMLPNNHYRPILTAIFNDHEGHTSSMLVHALPRHPLHTQTKYEHYDQNPTIKIQEKDINISDIAEGSLDNIEWGFPLVILLESFGHTEFKSSPLRSEEKPFLIPYNEDFILFERRFRLEKKSGLFILHQQPLTPPFFTCTTTFPDAIATEAIDKLREAGKGWRNFFDEAQINVEFSQTQ